MRVAIAGLGDVRVSEGEDVVSSLANLAGTLAERLMPSEQIQNIIERIAHALPFGKGGQSTQVNSAVETAMRRVHDVAGAPDSRRDLSNNGIPSGKRALHAPTMASLSLAPAHTQRHTNNDTSVVRQRERGLCTTSTLMAPALIANNISMKIGGVSGAFHDADVHHIVSPATSQKLERSFETPILLPNRHTAVFKPEDLVCTSFKGCDFHEQGFQFASFSEPSPLLNGPSLTQNFGMPAPSLSFSL